MIMLSYLKRSPQEKQCVTQRKQAYQQFKETISIVTMERVGGSNVIPVVEYGSEFETIANGVKGIRCSLDNLAELTTIVNVAFSTGAELGKHKHSKQTEWIFVAEGDLYVKMCYYADDGETLTNSKEYYLSTGDSLEIPANVAHYCKSEHGALLTVTWRPKFDTTDA